MNSLPTDIDTYNSQTFPPQVFTSGSSYTIAFKGGWWWKTQWVVDWDDGTYESGYCLGFSDCKVDHIYKSPGTHKVMFYTRIVPKIEFKSGVNCVF